MEAMDLVDSKLHYQYFTRVSDIDSAAWDSIVPRATGLKHKVLNTFEQSGINDLVCHYMLFKQGDKQIGKANLYEASMDLTSLDRTLDPNTRHIIKQWYPQFLNLTMIECGLFAMNGDGVVVKEATQLPDVIARINQKMHNIAAEKNLDLLVFRDVPLEQYTCYETILVPMGYSAVAGFSNAVIDIAWPSLEAYLQTLNSKDRYKLRTSMKISESFDIRIEVSSDYKHLAAEMAFLWANVNASSDDYNREQLDEAFFYEAGLNLQTDSEVILFYSGERLVAFMWNLIGDEDYLMADWGVDYDFPQYREANFYRAASLLSLKRAIELGKKRIQLGITNYTAKNCWAQRYNPWFTL